MLVACARLLLNVVQVESVLARPLLKPVLEVHVDDQRELPPPLLLALIRAASPHCKTPTVNHDPTLQCINTLTHRQPSTTSQHSNPSANLHTFNRALARFVEVEHHLVDKYEVAPRRRAHVHGPFVRRPLLGLAPKLDGKIAIFQNLLHGAKKSVPRYEAL